MNHSATQLSRLRLNIHSDLKLYGMIAIPSTEKLGNTKFCTF